jgi:flagellar basal body-associated protein FliL
MSTETPEQETPSKAPVLIISVVAVAIVAAAAGLYFFGGRLLHSRSTQQERKVAAVLHLEPFTVNLSDAEQKVYLRLGVDVGLERDPGAKPAQAPTALVRDTILTVLMSTKSDDLNTMDGKLKLKETLLNSLQQRAPELGVHEVYFTDFLIQR